MKQDYSDKILEEFDKHPIKYRLWADTRFFYLEHIWPLLHPIQNREIKKYMAEDGLNKLRRAMKHKELMQKYEHLTQEQVDLIWQKVFSDDDTDS